MNDHEKQTGLRQPVYLLLLCALFLLCLVLYLPGLNSLFLFDDFPNLGALEMIQGLGLSNEGFWEFVRAGESGPLGRPLTLFTFALQAEHWPDNPAAFKWLNLLFHLGNGVLVFFLLRELAKLSGLNNAAARLVPLITVALWLLHPAQTATVLYTVQRMTLLSHTFMLAALLCYLKTRLYYTDDWKKAGFLFGLAASVLLALTGMWAKENAASVLFYVLALEYTVLARQPANRLITVGLKLLWVPVALLMVLYLVNLPGFNAGFASRYDYGLLERLLTEARILWFYLYHSLVPDLGSTALFVHFEPSTGLFNPLTTLLAVTWWLVLTVLAFAWRRQFALPALALFWFLAGHVLESTVLPLELFFNHRNYLAMLGPLFLLVWLVFRFTSKPEQAGAARLIRGLPVALALFFAVQLFLVARLWSQPVELAQVWYEGNPEQSRNEQFLANQLAQQGGNGVIQAMTMYENVMAGNSGEAWPVLNWLILGCYISPPVSVNSEEVLSSLSADRKAADDVMSPLRQLNNLVLTGQCSTADQIPMTDILAILQEGMPDMDRGFIRYELAQHALQAGDTQRALTLMDEAFELTRDTGILFNQANLLINLEQYEAALALVDIGLAELEERNRIETGTREMKEQSLNSMRDYLVGVINEGY